MYIWIEDDTIVVQFEDGLPSRINKTELLPLIERYMKRLPEPVPEDFIYQNLQEMAD